MKLIPSQPGRVRWQLAPDRARRRALPCLVAWSVGVLLSGCPGAAPRSLESGQPIDRRLAAGEVHEYRLRLPARHYVRIHVTHRDVDVAVAMSGPPGGSLAEAETLPVSGSVEQMSLVTEAAGDYRLEVRSVGEGSPAGSYVVEIDEQRPARFGDGHRVAADRSYCRGYRLRLEKSPGSLRQAIVEYRRALAAWSRVGDPVGQARTLNAIGFAHRLLRDPEQALAAFAAALPFWRQAGDLGGEADTLNNMGFARHRLGDFERAVERYQQALERAEGDLGRMARVLNNLALVYKDQAQFDQTLHSFRRALELRRAAGDSAGTARILANLARAHSELQEQRQALDFYHEAIPMLRQAGDTRGLAAALNNLASSYGVLGQYERAISYYAEALEVSRSLGDRRGEGISLNNLGWALHFSNQPQAALERFEQALELLAADPDRKAEASTLHNAATSYRVVGEPEKATEYFLRALEIRRSERDRRGEAVTLTEMASIHIERSEIDKALALLESAVDLSRSVRDQRNEALALLEWARAEQQRDRLEPALDKVEEAIRIVEARRSKVASHQQKAAFLATKRRFYELWVDLLMELHQRQPGAGYAARALLASERARARSLVDMLEDGQVAVDRKVGAELERREVALQRTVNRLELDRSRLARREPAGPELARIEQRLITALAGLEQVRSQIRRSSPSYAALTEPDLLEVAELREQLLDSETILLELGLGTERSFLWVLTSSTLDAFELPGRAAIDLAARRVYEAMTARERSPEGETPERRAARIKAADDGFPATAEALSEMLLGQAAGSPGGGQIRNSLEAHRWLIVTEGWLSYVPFVALADPRRLAEEATATDGLPWRPLILEHEIVRLPSASALAVQRREQTRHSLDRRPLVVFADPVFSRDDRRIRDSSITGDDEEGAVREYLLERPLQSLRFASEEAESIAAEVPGAGADLLLGLEASKGAVIDVMGRYRVVHFATHALLNNRHPELSALVLSLFDSQGRAVDGFLRLHDIYNLRLEADLVVLSACQTALGREIEGEGLVGLTRGFMYAGAPRVLATLWTVQDRATMELMSRFYRRMLRDGERPAEAIRQAQLSLSESRRFSAPLLGGLRVAGRVAMTGQGHDILTQQALEALLAFLGTDAGEAVRGYEKLRCRLVKVLEIRVYEYRLRAAPEDLADEAIYRVASKLEHGLEIRASDPFKYFYGVARRVLQEAARQQKKDGVSLDESAFSVPEPEPEPASAADRRRCLDRCLERLFAGDRELILQFYLVDRGRARIAHRKRLAARLGLTSNALRIKAHRLRRQRLEPCVSECLGAEVKE